MSDELTLTIRDAPISIERRERTPEGFLRATAALTRAGVQRYDSTELNLPGPSRAVGVYRPVETVFDEDTKASARMKPVTLGHPSQDVTPVNYRQMAVGHLGDSAFPIDSERLGAYLTLTDAQAIEKVERGQDQVSAGYTMSLRPERGVHDGQEYEYRVEGPMQVNHLAIVDKGRAGDSVRVLDKESAMDEQTIRQIVSEALNAHQDDAKPADSAAIADAVARAVAPAVVEAVRAADEGRVEAEKKAADEAQAKQKAEVDMQQRATDRARLIVDCAPLLGGSDLHSMTDRQILEAAVKDSVPDATVRSDDYLRGVLATTLRGRDEASVQRAMQSQDGVSHNPMQASIRARDEYDQYLQDAWKGKVS